MNFLHSRTIAVMRKEFIHILRDPLSLMIALLQPVIMLFLYGYGVSSDINEIKMGVVDWSQTTQSRNLIDAFTSSNYFRPVMESSRYDAIKKGLDSDKIRVGLVIPSNFAARVDRGENAPVQLLVDGTDPMTALVTRNYIKSILQTYTSQLLLKRVRAAGLGAHPYGVPAIDPSIRIWYNQDLKSAFFIVPGLIVIVLMSTSALLTSGTIARERDRGTIELLVASPIQPRELMIGKLVAYVALSMLDVIIITLVGTVWFEVPLIGSIALLGICSGLFLMSALGIGLLISVVIPNQRTAMIAAMLFTNVPSVILSGFYFPISSMPYPVQLITYILPARYFMIIVRSIFLKGTGFEALWESQILPMTILGIFFLTVSIRRFRKQL